MTPGAAGTASYRTRGETVAQDETDAAARLAAALAKATPAIYGSWPHGATDQPNDLAEDLATALLPVVRELQAEADLRGYERGRRELAEYLVRVYGNARAATLRGEAGR